MAEVVAEKEKPSVIKQLDKAREHFVALSKRMSEIARQLEGEESAHSRDLERKLDEKDERIDELTYAIEQGIDIRQLNTELMDVQRGIRTLDEVFDAQQAYLG